MTQFSQEVGPTSSHVRRLNELLQSEYVGMYGLPDPNPEGGLELAHGSNGRGHVLFRGVDWGEDPIGMVGWSRLESGSNVAVLHRMYVHYEHRRNGYSKDLLRIAETSARIQGMRRMLLETGDVQTTAIALYRSQGYTDCEPFGFYAETAQDWTNSVFLGKDLA